MSTQTPDDLLTKLFPRGVRCVFSERLPATADLLGPKRDLTQRMSSKRFSDFLHGRYCAIAALGQLGRRKVAIGQGRDREPLWPSGIIGSISHGGNYAAAAVAESHRFSGIGSGIEDCLPLDRNMVHLVCRSSEIADLTSVEEIAERGKLLFCIKEIIYKCIWPSVQCFIEFREVEVELNASGNEFSVVSHKEQVPGEITHRLSGSYRRLDGLLVSSAWIPVRQFDGIPLPA